MAGKDLHKVVTRLSARENADIFQFSAPMFMDSVDRFRDIVCAKKKNHRENAILLLTTAGGDPDAAFRLSACLRRIYSRTSAYIFGICKSAGTLSVVGANDIVMGDYGEFGPLDVQLTKPDEIVPGSSGLDIFQALSVLKSWSFEAWQDFFLEIVNNSQGSISTRTAAEIARELAVGIFSPMTAQVEPERLGEVQRAINIANAYGKRLDKGGNLKPGGLDRLVQGYPSHTTVIDFDEAQHIFKNLSYADELQTELAELLPNVRQPGRQPFVADLTQLIDHATSRGTSKNASSQSNGTRRGSSSGVGANPANVASLEADVAGHASTAKVNGNSRSTSRATAKQAEQKPSPAE